MLHNLLFYRLVIFNALALVGVYVAYQAGLIEMVIEKDISHVTEIILGVVAFGVVAALARGYQVAQSINYLKIVGPFDPIEGDIGKSLYQFYVKRAKKLPAKNKITLNMAEVVVLLGLVGNCVGFIVALSNEDALRAGANTAFGATVFGLLAAIWMLVNYWTLEATTEQHLVDIDA
jgi:hypothetical protein